MNPILEYAVDHRGEACGILIRNHGVSPNDAEDIVQDAMIKVLRADPYDGHRRSYWLYAVRSALNDHWRRRKLRPAWPFNYSEDGGLLTDVEDQRQDCARQAEAAEAIQEACAIATASQRAAIAVLAGSGDSLSPNTLKKHLHHLRKRLRAAAVA